MAEATLWSTLMPVRRIKAALSWCKTCFKLVPANPNQPIVRATMLWLLNFTTIASTDQQKHHTITEGTVTQQTAYHWDLQCGQKSMYGSQQAVPRPEADLLAYPI
jgi:hypothetical protein